MPDETITEEQKQLKRILKRWTFSYARLSLTIMVPIVCGLLVLHFHPLHHSISMAILALFFRLPFFLNRLFTKYFVKRLSADEREVLTHIAKTSTDTWELNRVKELIGSPRSQASILLRASQQPQDDTLLRAAQYTDDTPKEQLLRPTSTDEK